MINQPEQKLSISGFAISGFVSSLIALVTLNVGLGPIGLVLCLLAIVFGIVALVKIKNKTARGKAFAIIGIVLGVIGIASGLLLYAVVLL